MEEEPFKPNVENAIIQNLFITNGSAGETVAFTMQLRDSDGIPAAFQMVCVRDESKTLESDIAYLTQFMTNLDYVNVIVNSNKIDPMVGGMFVENPRRHMTLKFVGPRWSRIY